MRKRLSEHWRGLDPRDRILRYVQPALVGLTDATISTSAPIFAIAIAAGPLLAFKAGLAAALAAAVGMGFSEAMSDDGRISGRGPAVVRGLVCGGATFVGGMVHNLPFLISDLHVALVVASVVVLIELVAIAAIRHYFLASSWRSSLIGVTAAGAITTLIGVAIGVI